MRLHTKILLGLLLGALVGLLANTSGSESMRGAVIALEPIGTVFIRLITMIVVPLVVGSLIVGTASLGDTRKLGRIGGKALGFFAATTVIAATIGVVLARLARPGAFMDPEIRDRLAEQFATSTAGTVAAAETHPSLIDLFVGMVPRNPIAAAAQLELLPLIVFTLIFGAALGATEPRYRAPVVSFFEGVNRASMVVIDWVMRTAPYAVFAIIAAVVARFGLDLLQSLLFYSLVVVVGLLIQGLGVFSLAIRFLARTSVTAFFRRVAEPLLVAFSTSSSNAALPVSLETAERRLGISKQISSFVLPLGATLNMNGSALYKAVTVMFIAQVYGVPLGFAEQLTIILTATLAAVAGVGVPGSSLVTTLIVLNAVGLGARAEVGIALVLGVDRLLDMLRTTVNVAGDLVATAYVARSEGERLVVEDEIVVPFDPVGIQQPARKPEVEAALRSVGHESV